MYAQPDPPVSRLSPVNHSINHTPTIMKFTLAILAVIASVAVAQDDGGLQQLKDQFPQYFQGVTTINVPDQYKAAAATAIAGQQ
ncbi:hypothetical protein CJU89_6855 [Yarrowia sp. B02]|nr:hypothetical protein CJU89_6855 [Yarrowia sp. B02]